MKMQFLKLFLPTIFFLVVLDMIWMGFIVKSLYKNNLGPLMKTVNGSLTLNWFSAAIVYVAITVGILVFALPKSDGTYLNAFLWGALFGLITYTVYEWTNYTVLAGWPFNVSIIDTFWGASLCGIATVIAAFVQNWLNS